METIRRLAIATAVLAWAPIAGAFGLSNVTQMAEQMAREPYHNRQKEVPPWMRVGAMTYDQWRDIRFRPDQALWREDGSAFQVQLFHPGLYFDRSVQIHVVDDGVVEPLPFSTRFFDYGKNTFADRIPSDIGYAGIRIHYPLKGPKYHDEIIVFLGASYFRALGRDNVYGLSARGLAIDTVEPGGEEFPHFIEFWLVKPTSDATSMELFALLDSPSVSGAYRFVVTPGVATRVDVEATLFARRTPKTLGLAPLTSMFFFGEGSTRRSDDFRPEVHDSDGLLVRFDSGEWLWRPLENPNRINVAGLATTNPRGFGLVQRDRVFDHFQDIETRQELRPSTWVEPRGDWGAGQIRLVEIPTDSELVDNIVAFWSPTAALQPGSSLPFAYTLWWYMDDSTRPPGGRAVATRRDRGGIHAAHPGYRWVIDFEGPALSALPADSPPRAVASATGGAKLFDQHVYKNPVTGGWRFTFQLKPKTDEPVELRAYLGHGKDVLTETWSSVWLK